MGTRFEQRSLTVADGTTGTTTVPLGRKGHARSMNCGLSAGSQGPVWVQIVIRNKVGGFGIIIGQGWVRADADGSGTDPLIWIGDYPLDITIGTPIIEMFFSNESGASVTVVVTWSVEE